MDSCGPGSGQIVGSCEDGSESSCGVTVRFSRKALLSVVSWLVELFSQYVVCPDKDVWLHVLLKNLIERFLPGVKSMIFSLSTRTLRPGLESCSCYPVMAKFSDDLAFH